MDKKLVANTATMKFDLENDEGVIAVSVANILEPVEIVVTIDSRTDSIIKYRTHENNVIRYIEIETTALSELKSFHEKLLENTYFIGYNLVNHLRFYLNNQLQLLQTSGSIKYRHKSLGFYTGLNGKQLFLYDKTLTSRGLSEYHNPDFKFRNGLEKDYDSFLKSEILPYKEMQLALVLGLSSVTASYLEDYADVQTLVLNMCGASSTGKSTSAQFIASLWASPKIGNDSLVKTFNSTDYARLHSIEGINGVPIIFDDATAAPNLNRTQLIYQLAQGESRGRMTNYGKSVAQGLKWSGLALITSETPLLSDSETRQGLIARVIETNDIVWTQSAEHATRIKNSIMDCYGHIGPKYFQNFIQINESDMKSRFDQAREEVLAGIEKVDNLTNRIVNKLSIIHLTSKLAEEILDFELDTDSILDMLIQFDQQNVEERHIALRAYEYVKYYIQRHHTKFRKESKGCVHRESSGELLGLMDFYEDIVVVSIPTESVKEILKSNRIYEYKTVLKYWGDKGMIKQQSNRNTINISALSGRVIQFHFEPTIDMLLQWKNITGKYEGDSIIEFDPIEPESVVTDFNDEDSNKLIFKEDNHED